jgi:hypothetical protein
LIFDLSFDSKSLSVVGIGFCPQPVLKYAFGAASVQKLGCVEKIGDQRIFAIDFSPFGQIKQTTCGEEPRLSVQQTTLSTPPGQTNRHRADCGRVAI